MLESTTTPAIAPMFRLQWEEVQDCYVILYPEGMVKLSLSAGEIMRRCDGKRSVDDIIEELTAKFPEADLAADTREFLELAYGNGWLH